MKHPHTYRALLRCGYSLIDAFELLLNARRGDRLALATVRTARQLNQRSRHASFS